jgi:hypothetical protein
MKRYPKLLHHNKGLFGHTCIAFDKLDGSNIRVEWDRKLSKKSTSTLGFKKFGTRNRVITHTNQFFGDAPDIFMNKYAEPLDKIFRENKYYRGIKKINIYLEYLGENSFAGQHNQDDEKDLVLFDVEKFTKGFVEPSNFIKQFGHLDIPEIIYQGIYTEDFVKEIKYNTDLDEGVVCKGVSEGNIWMVKIKTYKWLDAVKDKFGINYIKEDFNFDVSLYNEYMK